MFKSLYIHNFKCIKDLTVDFSYDGGKAPNGYKESLNHIFFQAGSNKNDRVVPVFTIYGPNASGKSTTIKAISILKSLIFNGASKDYFIPNTIAIFDKDGDRTILTAQFYCNKKLCSISFSFNETSILYEELKIDEVTVYCVKNSEIVSLNKTLSKFSDGLNELFKTQCVNAFNNQQENSLLGKIRKNYPGLSKDIISICDFFESHFIVLMKNNVLPYSVWLNNLANTFEDELPENRKKRAIKELVTVLNNLDIGITSLSVEETSIENYVSSHSNIEKIITPSFIGERFVPSSSTAKGDLIDIRPFHQNLNGQEVEFDYEEESAGTKRLIQILLLIMYALRTGKDLFIDELDDSLHSLLVVEIVRMFKSKRINSKYSQLICNLHNTDLLADGLLGASEIGLLSYSKKDGSVINKASQAKGIRASDDFRKKYLRGDFGGIPFPFI